jgi:hypothetical protein
MLEQELSDSEVEWERPSESSLVLPSLGGRRIVLGHPLISAHTTSPLGTDSAPEKVVDALLVERALAAAVASALGSLTVEATLTDSKPSFLAIDKTGIPVLSLEAVATHGMGAAVLARVALPGAPVNAFLARLDIATLEDLRIGTATPLKQNGWALLVPSEDGVIVDKSVQLLRRTTGCFQATGKPWTVGKGRLRKVGGSDKVLVTYASQRERCSREHMPATFVSACARLVGVFVDNQLRLLASKGG